MKWRDYQALQKVAELGEHYLSYVDEGYGEPVIFLHGIPTWGYLWHRYIAAFSPVRRVLIPDLLGFGYSDKSDRFDRSIGCQAEVIDAWMERLGIARATFVAHDIGGGVALRLATLYPQRVGSLCLMNSVCYDSWPIELMLQLGHPEANRRVSAGTVQTMLNQALRLGFAASPDEDVLAGLLVPYSTEVGKVSLIRDATALNTNLTTEITPLLTQIAVPTLIVWGEDDRFQAVKYAERRAADIPDATLVRIPNARHFVMFDQADEVARQVAAFV